MNKYYAMVDEAIRMTTEGPNYESQYMGFTTSKFGSSEKGMMKSSSEPLQISANLKSTTASKLKNQFKGINKASTTNAKELIMKRNIQSRQNTRATKYSLNMKKSVRGKQKYDL